MSDGEDSLKKNLDRFDQYVMNDIPIRLIRLSDMKLVGRNDVRKHFRGSVPRSDMPFPPSLIATYAILSHRWLDEGEPTYGEMKSGTASGPGYEKLRNFCEKARDCNLEFGWSDTCCIDKSSSTELDESIRSMFRWYQNSEICIIHLAQSETIEDITEDEWVQRGWTLQELLAPEKIKMFNKHWRPMTSNGNDKSKSETEVMKTLMKVTGIPLDDLSRFYPGPLRVDERMTWAARRKTTRSEDVAYSLMGIFNVSLQIAYGEGGDLAFCRLIEAIMQGGDPSVFNWTGEHAKHHSSDVFPRSPHNFAARALELPIDRSLRLEMSMSSIGLRVPLVVLPLSVISRRVLASGFSEVTAECSLCPAIKTKFVSSSYDTFGATGEFALGIVTYSLRSREVPRVRGKSAGFILYRMREDTWLSIQMSPPNSLKVCQPKSKDFLELEIISPPGREFMHWKKAFRTSLVEIDFPNIPSDSFFYISRKYLEIVYL